MLAEIGFRASVGSSDSLAPPSRVVGAPSLERLGDGSLLIGTAKTLGTMLTGLALGGLSGLAAGIALGFSETLCAAPPSSPSRCCGRSRRWRCCRCRC